MSSPHLETQCTTMQRMNGISYNVTTENDSLTDLIQTFIIKIDFNHFVFYLFVSC